MEPGVDPLTHPQRLAATHTPGYSLSATPSLRDGSEPGLGCRPLVALGDGRNQRGPQAQQGRDQRQRATVGSGDGGLRLILFPAIGWLHQGQDGCQHGTRFSSLLKKAGWTRRGAPADGSLQGARPPFSITRATTPCDSLPWVAAMALLLELRPSQPGQPPHRAQALAARLDWSGPASKLGGPVVGWGLSRWCSHGSPPNAKQPGPQGLAEARLSLGALALSLRAASHRALLDPLQATWPATGFSKLTVLGP